MLEFILAAMMAGQLSLVPPRQGFLPIVARTCKQVSSCEEAVVLWCDGYKRADGDQDGIPCENVCDSVAEVDAIRSRIGC